MNNPILIEPTRDLPRSVGIIGAGTIGPDIGYYLKSAIPGLKLVLIDINRDALRRAVDRLHAYADKGVARGKLTPEQAQGVRQNLTVSVDYDDLHGCDWVIEAATENIELKKQIFSQVEDITAGDCMITSNTSSIPAHSLFSHLRRPGRATVTHFFAPAFRNPVVEVIAWEQAEPDFIRHLRRLFYLTGKVPMLTRDVVCFMLDRIFDNWCNEAGFLLDDATPAQVDQVAGEYVHVGPFFVLNMSNGNPIIIETNSLQAELEGSHYQPAAIFQQAIDEARAAGSSASSRKADDPNPTPSPLEAKGRGEGDKWDKQGKWLTLKPGANVQVPAQSAKEIRDRLLGVLFSQSVDILDRDIGTAADLELGCRLAFAFRKGPLELMRELGEEETRRILDKFTRARPGMPGPQRPLHAYQDFHRFILVDELEDVKIITLRRPEALNALHDDMTDEILDLLRRYQNDPDTAGFIITGYGASAFCAGADIGRFPALLGDHARSVDYARVCSRLLVYLDTCKKPVVAALNGMTLGGGLELAIRCHGIVAVDNAWLQFPEITLGIAPGLGGMVIPYRRWPQAAAAHHDMLLKAQKMHAAEAHRLGIIDALAQDHSTLLPAARRRVRELAGRRHTITGSPVTVNAPPTLENQPHSFEGATLSRAVTRIIHQAIIDAAAATSLDDALETGYRAFGASACTAAAREGIDAFMEKRKPEFAE